MRKKAAKRSTKPPSKSKPKRRKSNRSKKRIPARVIPRRSESVISDSQNYSAIQEPDIFVSSFNNSAPVSSQPELPFSYNETKLFLMVRDPYCIFSYWDVSGHTWAWVQDMFQRIPGSRSLLRVHDVTDVEFQVSGSHSFYDVDVALGARNWYLHVNAPNREWLVDLALIEPSGKYHLIARSNRVKTPRDGPSDVIDEEWGIFDFDEIYALSGGFGYGLSSGEMEKIIKERYLSKQMFFSGAYGSISPQSR